MRYTRSDIQQNRIWNLPDDITAAKVDDHDPGTPTENLLGYRYAKLLTQAQITVLQDNGFDVGTEWKKLITFCSQHRSHSY